jgi:hypothetical protein
VLHGALESVGDHPFVKEIGWAIARLEQELVTLLGSARAYRILENVRVAVGFDGNLSAQAPIESERLRELRIEIVRGQEKLSAAVMGTATKAELRRINDDLSELIEEMHRVLTRERAENIIRDLKAGGLVR